MEGKELRFGIVNSAIWATATTAGSNGSVNSMHDSFMPLGGFVPLFMIQLGEIIYGGGGAGRHGRAGPLIVGVGGPGPVVVDPPPSTGRKRWNPMRARGWRTRACTHTLQTR